MITSFRHKGLEALFTEDQRKLLSANHVRRLRIILQILHAAHEIGDIARPGFDLHRLKGDRAGLWAVKVDANYRVTFAFVDGQVTDVDLVDYH